MPSWTPGSYLIREFARHVQEFQALDAASQQPLPWHKHSKNTWRVPAACRPATGIVLRYKVYANDLTVRTSHLDTSHGYFNGANLFVYLDGQRKHPVTLDRGRALRRLEGVHRPAARCPSPWPRATAPATAATSPSTTRCRATISRPTTTTT